MEKKDFESKLGEVFKAKLEDGQIVELKLTAVDPRKKNDDFNTAREEPFSLVFVGPKESFLPDNSYLMSVEGFEEKNIFISAFKQEEEVIYYDSTFN
jgi:hypothetical protein